MGAMKNLTALWAACWGLAAAAAPVAPENSKLFVKRVEPSSGAVSYLLKPGLLGDNQQSVYFTHRSMTDDGRFLIVWASDAEFPEGCTPEAKPRKAARRLALVDLETETARVLGPSGAIPFLDTARDIVYYPCNERLALFRRDLLTDPMREIKVAKLPPELLRECPAGRPSGICCHLTLNAARTKAFLDVSAGKGKWIQGMLDLASGTWEKWGETDFVINHGQINPADDSLALCAHEVRWTDAAGVKHSITNWNGVYPRLQLLEKGKRTMIPPGYAGYATHEHWTRDGKGFYWCYHGTGGETLYDLATKTRDVVCPFPGYHCTMTADLDALVFDHPVGPWYRGCRWMVRFWNRKTQRFATLYADSGHVALKENQSKLHPDPHPQFVCNDRYIVCTYTGENGRMNVMVTPVAGLLALTRTPAANLLFDDLPPEARPATIARRLSEHFLECPADDYKPRGYKYRNYGGKLVEYPLISLWANALACARLTGDAALEKRLVAHFDPFLTGDKQHKRSRMTHVDFTVFGALPLEIARLTGDARCRTLGLAYADAQWTPPNEGTLGEKHAFPRARQEDFWARGYTPQTRLWIDDMYMITFLQSQAYVITGDRTYMDRAAKETVLYLEELQRPNGLFYHAPDVPFVWGRGDGWMAAGMALNLKHLPKDSPFRERILQGYRLMMASLLKFQRKDGLWGQLVDEPSSWGETSGTAMFTYAFVEGVKNGWLDPETFGPAARKAYLALVAKLDADANLADVCIGTGKRNDHQYYLDRPREAGDPHGQAALMWVARALLEAGVR